MISNHVGRVPYARNWKLRLQHSKILSDSNS